MVRVSGPPFCVSDSELEHIHIAVYKVIMACMPQ